MAPLNDLCVHCKQPRGTRAGRGLCRSCWDDPMVRAQYPLIRDFPAPAVPRKLPAMRRRVFITGPLSNGSTLPDAERRANVERHMQAGRDVLAAGFAPIVPVMSNVLDPTDALGYENWLECDLAWLAVSDVLLRLPGESAGSEREVALARSLGIPVVHSIADIARVHPLTQGEQIDRQMSCLDTDDRRGGGA